MNIECLITFGGRVWDKTAYPVMDELSALSVPALTCSADLSFEENNSNFGQLVITQSNLLIYNLRTCSCVSQVKEFEWLQESLPRTCRLILTTTRSDISYRSLVNRRDVTVVNCPESTTDRQNTLSMVSIDTVYGKHCSICGCFYDKFQ